MEKFQKLFRKYKLHSYFFLSGGLISTVLIYGLSFFGISFISEQDTQLVCPTVRQDQPVIAEKKFLVDVRGAVNKPGVYEFKKGAIVDEIIVLAGGLKTSADMGSIDQNINFARAVSDREKLYFPYKQNSTVSQSTNSTSNLSKSKKVNLNTASQAELEELPGIGPSTAEKIIQGRPYKSINELLEVKGIGESLMGKIRDLIEI